MKVELTRVTTNPVRAIEEAACNCYDSEPSNGKIMRACFNSGHHSVLEFAQFTFHVSGVSRALLAQITRHRHASFAVRSQRYCEEDGFEFVTPPSLQKLPAWEKYYKTMIDSIQESYLHLLDAGIPAEDARYLLPNACCTTFEISMNGRELIHICNERLCTRAQWEIREMVAKMVTAVKEYDNEECAEFAKFLVPKCKTLGYCPEHSTCGRVPKKNNVMSSYRTLLELSEDLKAQVYNSPEFNNILLEFAAKLMKDKI